MQHYRFGEELHALYDKACHLYGTGQRGAATYFDNPKRAFLAANGLRPQDLYDYAEDFTGAGEPVWDTALAIEMVRRDYFLSAQQGRASAVVLDETAMPPKDAAAEGIEWLPRIIPKTKAKLRGELPESLMYCCGGDRRFFKAHDIHPAEFLSLIWRHEHDDAAVIDWVVRRSKNR